MYLWQEYRQPTSISEAIEDLKNAPKPVLPIAGGTDLLLEIKQGRQNPPCTLVDLTGVRELCVIEQRDNFLYIGASVPVNQIIRNPLVVKNAQALVEAGDLIAGPQVRNIATLGGNVAHALPAADGTIALVALDTTVEIAGTEGLRRAPIIDQFRGPGKSAIDKSSEIITGFYIKIASDGQGSAFKRFMRPQGVALPILNCAVWVHWDENKIKDIRIAIGPGGPTPFRATQAEEALRSENYDENTFNQALKILLDQATFRTSPRRATAAYRKYIVEGLFKDTLDEAFRRAAQK